MNSDLRAFVDAERKRVFEPGPHFATRVMARLESVGPNFQRFRPGIWDIVPGTARPVLALAAMLILAFLVIQSVVPAVPHNAAAADENLSVGADVLVSDEAFSEMIGPEGGL